MRSDGRFRIFETLSGKKQKKLHRANMNGAAVCFEDSRKCTVKHNGKLSHQILTSIYTNTQRHLKSNTNFPHWQLAHDHTDKQHKKTKKNARIQAVLSESSFNNCLWLILNQCICHIQNIMSQHQHFHTRLYPSLYSSRLNGKVKPILLRRDSLLISARCFCECAAFLGVPQTTGRQPKEDARLGFLWKFPDVTVSPGTGLDENV